MALWAAAFVSARDRSRAAMADMRARGIGCIPDSEAAHGWAEEAWGVVSDARELLPDLREGWDGTPDGPHDMLADILGHKGK
jgi:hypothetical protein